MLIPIVPKIKDDELLYGWYVRILQENLPEEKQDVANRFFQVFFRQREDGKDAGNARYDYFFNLENLCKAQSLHAMFPGVTEILKKHTDYYALLSFRPYGEQVKLAELILRPRTDRKICITVCQSGIKQLQIGREAEYLCVEDHLPGVRMSGRTSLLCCRTEYGKIIKDGEAVLKADFEAEERLSRFMRMMYQKPAAVSLEETKEAVRIQLEKKGFASEYPYGGLAEAVHSGGFAPFFVNHDIAVRVRKLIEQDSIIKEELAALLAFLFDEYDEFFDAVCGCSGKGMPEFSEFEILENADPIIKVRCKACGDEFYIHKYGPEMGAGCPVCDKMYTDEEIAMRYLSCLGDGNYEIKESFNGFGNKTEVLHRTCGKIRNVNFSDMIWGRKVCGCEAGVELREIQRRIDPTKTRFQLIEYKGARGEHQRVRIKCLCCGGEFSSFLRIFLEHPYCRCCNEGNRYADKFEEQVKRLGEGEYDLIVPYVNEKTMIKIRHHRCGTDTEMQPYNFINGQRCLLCTPAIRSRSTYSVRSNVYVAVKQACKINGGICFLEDIKADLNMKVDSLSSALDGLVKNGYLSKLAWNTYSMGEEYSPEEIAYRKYMFRNGNVEGVYAYESAAYHEGITDQKPEEEYIFTNLKESTDSRKVLIAGQIFRVRKAKFLVTSENQRIHTALNLLMYVAGEPEKACAVRRWMEEKGMRAEDLEIFVRAYPLSAGKGMGMVFG